MFDKLKELIESKPFKVFVGIGYALSIIYRFYVLYLEQKYWTEGINSINGDNYDFDIAKERVFNYVGELYPESSDEQILEIVDEIFTLNKKII